MRKKRGKITPNGVSLEKHENDMVVVFTNAGYDVELIPPCRTAHTKNPDIYMAGMSWELKSPQGKGRWLLEKTLQRALRQSPNIIIDLRRIHLREKDCIAELSKQAQAHRRVKHLKVITRKTEILDLK